MDLEQRYAQLLNRRMPFEDRGPVAFSEKSAARVDGWSNATDDYLTAAMSPIDAKYTERLVAQGSRIENQLRTRLASTYPNMHFRRQGSVSNDTHIRHSSDVDVLAIEGSFETIEMPQANPYPYAGEPLKDLLAFRTAARDELASAFCTAVVDDSGSTAIRISRGSLACSVDVVPSNWYNTLEYARSGSEIVRGVQVLNKQTWERPVNYPFKFNHRIDIADLARSGATRRMIRLLKTLKADLVEAEKGHVSLSSYDLCSLVYRMVPDFCVLDGRGVRGEAIACLSWVNILVGNHDRRDAMLVVDDSRKVFDSPQKHHDLNRLKGELANLLSEKHSYAVYDARPGPLFPL